MTDLSIAVGSCLVCGAVGGSVALPEPIAVACRRARDLTPREYAVLRLLGSGYDNRAISRELNIIERTVKRYVTAILAKLGLRSRLQAGLCALLLSSVPAASGWPEGLMARSAPTGEDD